ncbi:potassium channel subfamily K member 1-like [Watersipora subatra]|uniref:potassium channel subfamily K member 1-like n=1 Tax=Watersipora subatra TaxID=2589382 RepID=UPI00355AFC5C
MVSSTSCQLGLNTKLFVFTTIVFFYLIFGAAVFSGLEQPIEKQYADELRHIRQQFATKVNNSITHEELEEFLQAVINYNKFGVLVTNNVTFQSGWTFGEAFFFTCSLLTTVGYGYTIPLSDSGKLFAIFYATFGVPLTFVMLSAVTLRLMKPLNLLLRFLRSKLLKGKQDIYMKLVHLAIVLSTLLLCIFLLPAAIFSSLESEWNYLDSLYYCIISVSTIGLGDYVPGNGYSQPSRTFYQLSVSIYLFFGIICVMVTIRTVTNIKQLNFVRYFSPEEEVEEREDQERQSICSVNTSTNNNYNMENARAQDNYSGNDG